MIICFLLFIIAIWINTSPNLVQAQTFLRRNRYDPYDGFTIRDHRGQTRFVRPRPWSSYPYGQPDPVSAARAGDHYRQFDPESGTYGWPREWPNTDLNTVYRTRRNHRFW